MSSLDWIVMSAALLGIALYGAWRTRVNPNLDSYFRASGKTPWYLIGISVMATQASAITFLSTPGQAYADGMGFVQFYFGLPLALIIVSLVAVPVYQKLRVMTAYEYLESRFDRRVRQLAAFLFLLQRGFAAGLTIYAPAIIFSSLLGWNLDTANVLIGSVVIIYTVIGGTRAVNVTQLLQMGVIFSSMIFVFFYTLSLLGQYAGPYEALRIAAVYGRTETIDFSFDPSSRYTLWSGLTGGFFLALSYFGTDQSQVQRYLAAESAEQSRMGLMFNALLKVPMQFFILSLGVLVFVLFQFERPPLFFNQGELQFVRESSRAAELQALESEYEAIFSAKQAATARYNDALTSSDAHSKLIAANEMRQMFAKTSELREEVKQLLREVRPGAETKDTDYVFLTFIIGYLPQGILGLLLAAIICAAMSSTAGELNALASTTVVDFYQRSINAHATDVRLVAVSKLATFGWGVIAIGFATIASLFENLIQAVNIVGSIFYGTILGIFITAFASTRTRASDMLPAAFISQGLVIVLFLLSDIGFLWFNFIGCTTSYLLALAFSLRSPESSTGKTSS